MAHGDAREEVKGKQANALGSQYSSHYLGTWCIQHYYRSCAHLGCQQSTELTPTGRFKWTRSLSHERRNLVSARVPLHFNWPLHTDFSATKKYGENVIRREICLNATRENGFVHPFDAYVAKCIRHFHILWTVDRDIQGD